VARFVVGRPITTQAPTIDVDAGLTVGSHRFQLEVTRADGRISRPDVAVVRIIERIVVDPRDPLIVVTDPRRDPLEPVIIVTDPRRDPR